MGLFCCGQVTGLETGNQEEGHIVPSGREDRNSEVALGMRAKNQSYLKTLVELGERTHMGLPSAQMAFTQSERKIRPLGTRGREKGGEWRGREAEAGLETWGW